MPELERYRSEPTNHMNETHDIDEHFEEQPVVPATQEINPQPPTVLYQSGDGTNLPPTPGKGGHKLNKVLLLLLVLVVIAAVVVGVIIGHRNGGTATNGSVSNVELKQADIQITADGFVPSDLQITPGTEVVWQNTTSSPQAVGAAPFPSHSSLPELDSGTIGPHQSFKFLFNMPGTWKYQNDLKPLAHGSVDVKGE